MTSWWRGHASQGCLQGWRGEWEALSPGLGCKSLQTSATIFFVLSGVFLFSSCKEVGGRPSHVEHKETSRQTDVSERSAADNMTTLLGRGERDRWEKELQEEHCQLSHSVGRG